MPPPRTVVVLGLVSMCMDLSSEMTHALLPLFLVGTLGAPVAYVGLIEGIAEATAAISKLFSGVISDWIGRRKPLVLLGYGLSGASKPLFPLAQGIGAVLLNPQAAPWKDAISRTVKHFNGREYTISRPRDLWFAVSEMVSHIVKSRNGLKATTATTAADRPSCAGTSTGIAPGVAPPACGPGCPW